MRDQPTSRLSTETLATFALCGLVVLQSLSLAGCSKKAAVPARSTAPSTAASEAAAAAVPVPVPDAQVAAVVKAIESLPVTMKVAQRTTTAVPGAAGELSLTVDDVTRGQVMISLLDKQGTPLVGPASMKQDQSLSFRLGDATYAARVAELSNVLVGDDLVTIVIDRFSASDSSSAATTLSPPAALKKVKLTEKQKIEKLIAIVAAQGDAKFIRNGTAYSPGEAAEHLRTKLENAGGRVVTAADFIDKIASKSSVSGKDYLIQRPDGRVVTTAQFLRKELSKLEKCATSK